MYMWAKKSSGLELFAIEFRAFHIHFLSNILNDYFDSFYMNKKNHFILSMYDNRFLPSKFPTIQAKTCVSFTGIHIINISMV